MLAFFRALADRLKALFLTDAALDLEAHVLSRAAERKADLLRQAASFEAEGLTLVGSELRQQAAAIDLGRPLAIVLPGVEHLAADHPTVPLLPGLTEMPNGNNGQVPALPEPAISPKTDRKSGRKSRGS